MRSNTLYQGYIRSLTQVCLLSLVCSDLISRGIDISHVSHVVSYDAPIDMRKYVHRVGRTARAGRAGSAWTLVEEQEVSWLCARLRDLVTGLQARYFKNMMKEADHLASLKKVKVDKKEMEALRPLYTVSFFTPLFPRPSTY